MVKNASYIAKPTRELGLIREHKSDLKNVSPPVQSTGPVHWSSLVIVDYRMER